MMRLTALFDGIVYDHSKDVVLVKEKKVWVYLDVPKLDR
jgi:hypothetical protein